MTTTEPPAIEFVDELPPHQGRRGRSGYAGTVIPALQANPGRWAKVKEYPLVNGKYATGSYSGLIKSFRRQGAEAESRRVGDIVAVYARWPEQSDDDQGTTVTTVTTIGGTPHTMSERVAAIYLDAIEDGASGIRAVMDRFGIGEAGAKAAITKARKAGLIPTPSKGGAA